MIPGHRASSSRASGKFRADQSERFAGLGLEKSLWWIGISAFERQLSATTAWPKESDSTLLLVPREPGLRLSGAPCAGFRLRPHARCDDLLARSYHPSQSPEDRSRSLAPFCARGICPSRLRQVSRKRAF